MLINCVTCLLAVVVSADQELSAAEVEAGVQHRIDELRNLRFVYRVDATFWEPPKSELDTDGNPLPVGIPSRAKTRVKSIDEFKILDPEGDDRSRPRRSWQRQSGGSIERFYAYDSHQTAIFIRKKWFFEKWNQGGIMPFEDTTRYQENHFDDFLVTNVNGMKKYDDPNWKLTLQVDKQWDIVGTREFQGRNVHVLQGHLPQWRYRHEVHVTDAPEFMLIRREVRSLDDAPDAEPRSLMEVTSIGKLDSVTYPSAGRFVQRADGSTPRIEYQFEVKSAERLTEQARANWLPEWPSRTVVRDHANDVNFTVP